MISVPIVFSFKTTLISGLLLATLIQPAVFSLIARMGRLWFRRSATRALLVDLQKVAGPIYRIWAVSPDAAQQAPTPSLPDARKSRIQLPGLYADAGLIGILGVILSISWAPPGHSIALDLPLGIILIVLGLIDLRWFWLPDRLTLPLCVIGLLAASLDGSGISALAGLIVGASLFLSLRIAYHALRGRQGIGLGDVKLAAAIGAWLQTDRLLETIVLAAGTALVVTTGRLLISGRPMDLAARIPFGLFLVLAMWIEWIDPLDRP
jgi:prepilin signal peptidase PulO-like enzyme (type II secretory pathway)